LDVLMQRIDHNGGTASRALDSRCTGVGRRAQVDETDCYERARARVRSLRGFYVHATVYVLVNLGLLVVNLVSSPHRLWFFWVALGWGIGLGAHALGVFGPQRRIGAGWEQRKIREEMECDRGAG
jgi:2TM domain